MTPSTPTPSHSYADRGVIAAVLPLVEHELELNKFMSGTLASGFMVGFITASLFVGPLSRVVRPTTVMCGGLILWAISAFVCSFSPSYPVLLVARCIIGCGEASYVSLAPTLVDDAAPPSKRTRWLGVYFCTIFVGYAGGYGLAGGITTVLNWRVAFLLEGLAMTPIAIMCLLIPQKYPGARVRGSTETAPLLSDGIQQPQTHSKVLTTLRSIWEIISNPIWLFVTLGYAAFTFVQGAVAFFVNDFLVESSHLPLLTASLTFGLVMVVCGLVGTWFGGWVVDRMGGGAGPKGMARACLWSVIYTVIATPLSFVAFLVDNLVAFYVLLSIGLFFFFCSCAPVNGVVLSSVPSEKRNMAMALNVVFIHSLGDFPSPVICGYFMLHSSMRLVLTILQLVNIFAIIFWSVSWGFAVKLGKEQNDSE